LVSFAVFHFFPVGVAKPIFWLMYRTGSSKFPQVRSARALFSSRPPYISLAFFLRPQRSFTSTDGAATDGSYGLTGSGAERVISGASAVCPAIAQHVTGGICP